MPRESRTRLAAKAPAFAALALALAMLGAVQAAADDITFFRIGTGATGGTYFPVGGLIANAISNPPGSRPCDRGGSCGVDGLIAVAQSTQGSVENVAGIKDGSLESGLSQADVAYWAHRGRGIFRRKGKVAKLRAIANLYPESVHIVVRRDSGIASVRQLKGRRVSLGEKESGTLVDANIILAAHGLKRRNLKARYLKLGQASDQLREGKLDAFFFVAGYPAAAIAELAQHAEIALIPIAGRVVPRVLKRYPFFAAGSIPEGAYEGVDETPTLTVGAQWLVSADVDEELVYGITRALWHETTRKILDRGHPDARQIRLETALDGIGIPLHRGAARYYAEIGVLDPEMEAGPARPKPRIGQ